MIILLNLDPRLILMVDSSINLEFLFPSPAIFQRWWYLPVYWCQLRLYYYWIAVLEFRFGFGFFCFRQFCWGISWGLCCCLFMILLIGSLILILLSRICSYGLSFRCTIYLFGLMLTSLLVFIDLLSFSNLLIVLYKISSPHLV